MMILKKTVPIFSLVCLLLLIQACNKNSLELAPIDVKPITTTTEVSYEGQKLLDLQLDRFNYADSSFAYVTIRNLAANAPDSLSVLLYYFKSNSQVYDSVAFLPLIHYINRADTHRVNFTRLNTRIPAVSAALHAQLIYYKSNGVAGNIISGTYDGYAIQQFSASATPRYSASKGFINSEGSLSLWIKDTDATSRLEALLPKDTTALVNIFSRSPQDELTGKYELDVLSGNKHFDVSGYKLDFAVKNAEANADPKTIQFNLIKNSR